MAIHALSILIPTYNDLCVNLVGALRQQAEHVGLAYEILVADDGSTDADVIAKNSGINQWEHCQCLRQSQNIGRAAIRNFLARQAQYDHLLFIDSEAAMPMHSRVISAIVMRWLKRMRIPQRSGNSILIRTFTPPISSSVAT